MNSSAKAKYGRNNVWTANGQIFAKSNNSGDNIRRVFPTVTGLSNFLNDEKLDFIGLSETWLNETISSGTVSISGYNIVRNDRSSRGGGVGFYFKDPFKVKVVKVTSSEILESLWISTKVSVFIGGDFNVDFLGNSYEKTKLCSLLSKYGLHKLCEKPTRITEVSKSAIDLLIVTDPSIVHSTNIVDMSDMSDHSLAFAI
nr:unnamed protein product [Callosobruchus analis]